MKSLNVIKCHKEWWEFEFESCIVMCANYQIDLINGWYDNCV